MPDEPDRREQSRPILDTFFQWCDEQVMDEMVAALEKATPGSPEALEVRRRLVQLSRRPKLDEGGEL